MPGPIGTTIIALFGALGWILAILVTIQRIRLLTRGVKTMGTIKRSKVSTDIRSDQIKRTTQSAVVQVYDEATGEKFEFSSSFGTSASKIQVGKKVPVRYMADDHEVAEIDQFLPMWFFPLGAAVIGTLLLGSLWYQKFRIP